MKLAVQALLGLVVFTIAFGVVRADGEEAPAAEENANAEKHGFQAEVSKMLDIIINSLYTNRNIFLREVISNASDALDKIRFLYLTEPKTPVNKDGTAPTMDVRIKADKEARTLTITDGGIGMTKEDMIKHLGSLGSSGTKNFVEKMKEASADNLIGQFGVGFYSVFLVADEVKVSSKHDDSDKQWVWKSKADGEFFMYEDTRGNTLGRGTEIELMIKKDAEEYLDTDKLNDIATKYSEFIQFPIYIRVEKTERVPKTKDEEEEKEETEGEEEKADEEEEFEEVTTYEWKHINANKPIWQRKADDITEEEYNSFYKAITKDYADPLTKTHFSAEGEVEFKSILYIPKHQQQNQFQGPSQEAPKNIRLYVRRVFITDEFTDLLPRYLSFVQGVVDSDDLPLNVSRELLQESRILKIIKKKLIRKALSMMKDLADADDEEAEKDEAETEKEEDAEAEEPAEKKEKQFPTFWKEFGRNIRLGVIEDGTNRSRLTKLLRYQTSKSGDELVSLDKYVEGMLEGQKEIYFIVGDSLDKLKATPAVEDAVKRGIEVIFMLDAIDEYVVGHLTDYSGHKLVNIATETPKIGDEDAREKKVEKARKERYQPLVDWFKDLLGERVTKVVLTKRHIDAPLVVSSPQHGITANMARIMKGQALGDANGMYSNVKRVLELNIRNPIIDEIYKRVQTDADDQQAKDTANILFDIYSLQGGFELDQPKSLATQLERMLKNGLDLDPATGLVEEEEYELEEEEEEAEEEAAEGDDIVVDEEEL